MPVNRESRRILKGANYPEMRERLIQDIMGYINEKGRHGKELCKVIGSMLKKEEYSEMVTTLLSRIEERTDLDREEGLKVLAILLEEDIGPEIRTEMRGNVEERKGSRDTKDRRLKEKGEKKGLWSNASSTYLGRRRSHFPILPGYFPRHR